MNRNKYSLEKAIFFGELINGKREGEGIQVWENGTVYIGVWNKDQINWSAESDNDPPIDFPDAEYIMDGNKNPCPKFFHSNGDIYSGEFVNSKAEGYGIYISQDNEECEGYEYVGEWKADKKHGEGIEIVDNGGIYEGTFKNGLRRGKGTYTYEDDSVYTGNWANNKMHGKGIYEYPNGKKYDGDFYK